VIDDDAALLERQNLILEHLHEAVEMADADGRLEYVNPAWEELTGWTAAEALGKTPAELLRSDAHPDAFWEAIDAALEAGRTWSGRLSSRAKNGDELPLDVTLCPVVGPGGGITHVIAVRRDIRETLRTEELLKAAALHDALTGLPNRTLFYDRLTQALARSERRDGPDVAVLIVDLDGYRVLVETHGRHTAELMLQSLAPRLRSVLRPEDTLARFGGDEFAVVLTEATSEDTDAVAERLLARVSRPLDADGRTYRLRASIGVALHEPGLTGEELVTRADRALARAKERGKARVEFFASPTDRKRTPRTVGAAALRRALGAGSLQARFEPIVDLVSERVVGFETLARWPDAPPGLERPDAFIPLAEETGQLFALADVMLEEAGRLVTAIEDNLDYFPVGVTLNVSAAQLVQEDLVGRIAAFLEAGAVDPAMLQLEITERSAMRDPETAIATCTELRKLGVRIAIDDFGTGHSSLSHLQRFPVSTVKIDKSFVRFVDTKTGNREIVRAIMALAEALGLEVIAEGVERREEHNTLLTLGCRRGQGWLYGRAVDHDEALAVSLRGSKADFPALRVDEDAPG